MPGPHHTQCVALALGGGPPPSTEPRRDRQRPPTEENQHLLKRQERARSGGACRGGPGKHPSRRVARSSRSGPPRTRAHTLPPHRSGRSCAPPAPCRPVRRRPRGFGRTRNPGRTRSPRALAARGAGWGRRVGAQGRLPKGHRAEAQAFTCAGQGPGGGQGQERQQQPHPAQERRHVQAGGRARRKPPGVRRPGGPGFYSGAATGGSPDSGTRVAAPPLSGASPPRVLSLL